MATYAQHPPMPNGGPTYVQHPPMPNGGPTYVQHPPMPNGGPPPQGMPQQAPPQQVIIQQAPPSQQPQVVQEIKYGTMPPQQANQPQNPGQARSVTKEQHIPLAKCRVLYLGSAVPLETAQGLDAVQQPLKERYPVESDGDVPGIDAWVTVYSSGMLMQYVQDKNSAIWFPIQTLHVCAAVKCVTSINGATGERLTKFIGLDNPAAEKTKHPPMFAAIMRRTKGVKVLECHVFIAKSNQAAMALVQSCTHAYEHKEGWTEDSPPNDTLGGKNETRLVPAEPIQQTAAPPEFFKKPPAQGYFYTTSKELVKNYNVFGGGAGKSNDTQERRPPPPSNAQSVRDDQPPEQRPVYPLGRQQPPPMPQQPAPPMPQQMPMYGAMTPFGPVMTGMPPPVGVPHMRPNMMPAIAPIPPMMGTLPPQAPVQPAMAPMLPMPPRGYFADWDMYEPQPVYFPSYDETMYTNGTSGRRERRRTPSPRRKREKSPKKVQKSKPRKPRGRSPQKHYREDDYTDDYGEDDYTYQRRRPRTPEADYDVSPRRRPKSPKPPRDFPYGYDRKGPGSDLILYANRYQRQIPRENDNYRDETYGRGRDEMYGKSRGRSREREPPMEDPYRRNGDYGGYSTSFHPKGRDFRDDYVDDEDPYNYNRELPRASDVRKFRDYVDKYSDELYDPYSRERVLDPYDPYSGDGGEYHDHEDRFGEFADSLGFLP